MLTSRRVLLLAETCAGGVGRHVLDLTEGLAELGHEVHLLYSPLRSDAVVSTRIPLLAAGARNIRIRPMRIQRLPHASDLAACWALRQYLRAHGPFDVIHSHGTKAGLLGRAGVLGNPAVRVYTPHCSNTLNPHLTVLERKILAGMENVLAMIGDGVIAVSTEEYEHLRTLGIPDSKVFLVPNGIRVAACDMAREEKRRKLGLSADAVCVGFVGRLVREKSLEVLLQAFALLLPEISGSTRLAVVGDGPLSANSRPSART